MSRNDVATEITNMIIERLEQGGVMPWRKPWAVTGGSCWPTNWSSKAQYNGINILVLWFAMEKYGYTSNYWLTFKQAKQLGGNVRKGEKGHRCVYFKALVVEDDDQSGSDVEGGRTIPMRKAFTVFNLDQIEGIDAPQAEVQTFDEGAASQRLEAIFAAYSANTGVKLLRGGDQAYYRPSTDTIVLPNTFYSEVGYIGTFAHELVHSTGHSSRLDRFSKDSYDGLNPKQSYCAEELVAEIGSGFLSAELGIEVDLENHASYIDSWLTQLRKDRNFVFKAAARASKAFTFIMEGGAMKSGAGENAA